MKLGISFPQQEIGTRPEDILHYVQTVEEGGFAYLTTPEHVLTSDTGDRPGPASYYNKDSEFHEPFVLFGFLAGRTSLELTTGIIVLPQRQTTVVAKQAAQVDILSGGRLRLGVGIGWNEPEYDALGMDFHTRGARIEEQVKLLRLLFTQRLVTFDGRFHHLEDQGILPLPVQQPIPIWLGGRHSHTSLRRVGRIADGWITNFPLGELLDESWALVRQSATASGRDPAMIGLQGGVHVAWPIDLEAVAEEVRGWERFGATHLSLTVGGNGRSPEEHVEAVRLLSQLAR